MRERGKVHGMDGMRVEMLKEWDVTAWEWLVRVFNICSMLLMVPVDWVIACVVLHLYQLYHMHYST